MELTTQAAWLFLPFVVPICIWAAWNDMRAMKIPNKSVIALALVFILLGLFVLPLNEYLWRLSHLVIVLLAGIVLNAAGALGAGDAKFAAAAAPFIAMGDLGLLLWLYAANLLAAYLTHRLAKNTKLRELAPEWKSWHVGPDFPMGFSLGGTLAIYLAMGTYYGS
ncbi:prepilin peptidase [Lentibacter sp. XHP0401]|jgi:prepilin peptidase CpaA|uniref:prepilin peptidase n=1 Tax=Lentibacter sp. XHP0401 TaxID=2984334 RepID=UPI0021E8AF61|nr:prepilin peptidase [Lentibacter sp. XHP0401]MCV2893060.1 prepilin peptidase [Lentibacter sp. XHP0401]